MALRYVMIKTLLAVALIISFELGAVGKVLCFADSHTKFEDLHFSSHESQQSCGYCVDLPIRTNILVSGSCKLSNELYTPSLNFLMAVLLKNIGSFSNDVTLHFSRNFSLALVILKTIVLLN